MSTVVGIDPSLTVSGCARVDLGIGADGQLEAVRWETWRARAVQPAESTVESERRRVRQMLREILAFVPDFVDIAVIEGAAPNAKNRGKAEERSWLRGFLIDQMLSRGAVVVVDPMRRALLATGAGNAKKGAVLDAVRVMVPAAHVPDHNVADAVALAMAGAHHLGMPWVLTEKQEAAFAKVAWPSGEGIQS